MISKASTPEEYLKELPDTRLLPMQNLRDAVLNNLPKGFIETMSYGMLAYVVPLSIYPNGYHCKKNEPLPFINIASQKNYISFYHMGLYGDSKLLNWFESEYPKHTTSKLDMGKCCIRFKKMDQIPYELISKLVGKLSPQEWIEQYEKVIKR